MMADRTFPGTVKSMDRAPVQLFGVVTFGGSGAVASVDGHGFTVTKPSGTGLYRITLEDKYAGGLLGVSLTLFNGGTAADSKLQLHAEYSASAKTIDFQVVTGTAAANATDEHKAYITLTLSNTSVPRKGV
jgi:hypothetical protein